MHPFSFEMLILSTENYDLNISKYLPILYLSYCKEDNNVEWIEKKPIPEECEGCQEADCYNCDIAGRRWVLSAKDELLFQRGLKLRAIARLQRQVAEIDQQLHAIDKNPNNSL